MRVKAQVAVAVVVSTASQPHLAQLILEEWSSRSLAGEAQLEKGGRRLPADGPSFTPRLPPAMELRRFNAIRINY
jgi:hypothetical protein